jgi:hypothetical protein
VKTRTLSVTFDAVLNEHSSGAVRTGTTGTLADLVLVSPRAGDLDVAWHRQRIDITPSKAWRPNTVYTVTILPGLSDLYRNTTRTPVVTTFSTGPSIPGTSIAGTMFDWEQAAPPPNAFVEAISRTDTLLSYISLLDSLGRFQMRGMQPGTYFVRGVIDPTQNLRYLPDLAFDSATVTVRDSVRLELLAFAHDTTGPRMGGVAVQDSVTLRLAFDTPIDPAQPLDPAHFAVVASDSSLVAIDSVMREGVAPAPIDTTRGAVPPAPTLPKPSKPSPFRAVIVRLKTPLRHDAQYRMRAIDLRGPAGARLTSEKVFTTPTAAERP